MSSSSTSPAFASQPVERAHANDRVFYSGMAIALAVVVFAGFARTYYVPLFSGGPTLTIAGLPFTTLVHVHAALFTAWVALFIAQTALVANRRVALHRKLGIAGAVLAGAMVVAGFAIRIWEFHALRGPSVPLTPPVLVFGMFDMIMFAVFVSTAIVLRRNSEAHKRLMLLAYVCILTAAVARVPGVPNRYAYFAFSLLPLFAGVAYDIFSRRRVHKVYLWGGTLFAVMFGAMTFASV
jgi:hypothetical protein